MKAPQVIVLALLIATVVVAAILDGQPQMEFNWITSLINSTGWYALLRWGGFFR